VTTGIAAARRPLGLTGAWEALTPRHRRGLLYEFAAARKEKTRARGTAVLVATVGGRA